MKTGLARLAGLLRLGVKMYVFLAAAMFVVGMAIGAGSAMSG
jgi:hypothetical protein